jgi:hypothetical protein
VAPEAARDPQKVRGGRGMTHVRRQEAVELDVPVAFEGQYCG